MPLDSAVNIGFPAIVRRFDLSIPMIQWVVISYVLTQTSLVLSFGRIGDIVGYRRVFLAGTGVSALAFVGCALAPTYPWLLAGRVAQGIGAGLIIGVGPALATSLFAEDVRPRVLGYYMMMFGLGSALGPLVFGLLLAHFGWSAVFSFRSPLAAASFLLAWALPADAPSGRPRAFDAAGGALLAAALALLLLALNQVRQPLGLAVCAGLSAAAFAGFIRHERHADQPMIDLRCFRDRGFTWATLVLALVNLAGFAVMLLVPFYLSSVTGLSVPMAGAVLAAQPVGMMLAAPVAGRLLSGPMPSAVMLAGLVACAAGLALLSLAGASPENARLTCAMIVQGFGMGLVQVACFERMTAAIPRDDRGVAGALGMAARSIGIVTGATVLMLVFQSVQATGGFVPAFQAAMLLAAAIPAVLLLLGWAARHGRRPV